MIYPSPALPTDTYSRRLRLTHEPQRGSHETADPDQDCLARFRREHCHLTSDLYKLSQEDLAQGERRRLGRELLARMERHVADEESHVYAVLADAADHDNTIATTLRIFGPNMASMTLRLLDFFRRCTDEEEFPRFPAAAMQALSDLRELVRREETLLFAELDRIRPPYACARDDSKGHQVDRAGRSGRS
jgi:hypothetical protein